MSRVDLQNHNIAFMLDLQEQPSAAKPSSDGPLLHVVIDGCRFESNTPQVILSSCAGVICLLSRNVQVEIRRTLFIDNNYTSLAAFRTFLIDVVEGGLLEVADSCFINNSVIGSGLITLHRSDDYNATSVYGENNHLLRGGTCNGAHFLVTDECHEFHGVECRFAPDAVPIAVGPPTSVPISTSGAHYDWSRQWSFGLVLVAAALAGCH